MQTIPVFLELKRADNGVDTTGSFINLNEVMEISHNDTDNIRVLVIKHLGGTHLPQSVWKELSVHGTRMFRDRTGILKTNPSILDKEQMMRGLM